MTRDDDDDGTVPGSTGATRLRAVAGPLAAPDARPAVRLTREFKGPTAADLLRDEFVERLPGQVRSALHHIERGDLAAAERALPGEFSPVLAGPGHERARRRHYALVAFAAGAAALAGGAFAAWLVS